MVDKKGQPVICKDDNPDHVQGVRCKRKRLQTELRCYRCAGRRRVTKRLDEFNRETAIGFAAPFTVALPEATDAHLRERFASMWTEGLNKIKNWDKLPPGAVPLTGGKLEVFHSSAGSGSSKLQTQFYDTVLLEEDRKHLDIFVETLKAELLQRVKGDYLIENCAFLINMDLVQQKGRGKKEVVLSTLSGWQPWHLDQPLNTPLSAPAHHLAVIGHLGPASPTRICTAPHMAVDELCQRLGASTLEGSTPDKLACDRDFLEQCQLMFPKEYLDAFAADVGGKARVQLGDCALVGGVHQGVANLDRTPRVVFSANLALRGVASYNPDVQLNPVNALLYYGFWEFGVKEYVKYLLAGTDLISTCDDRHSEILASLAAEVPKVLKIAVDAAARV